MALKRRSGSSFSANIWPGFVDAMTALLLVLMFVLTIFMIVQFVLRDTINGQDAELDDLSVEIQGLASALGLERSKSATLEDNVTTLNSALSAREQEASERQSFLDALTIQSDEQVRKIADIELKVTSFEAQVAGLLLQNNELSSDLRENRSKITVLTGEASTMLARNQRLTANLAGQASQNATLSAQNRNLGSSVAELQAQNRQLVDDLAGQANQNTALSGQNKTLSVNLADQQAQNRQLAENVAGQASQNTTLSAQNETLSNNLAEQRAQNRQLAENVAGQARANAQLAEQNRALTAQNQQLAQQNQDIADDAQGQADKNAELTAQNQLLLADKDAIERANLRVISEREALQLALVQARDEIDEGVEAARLAAIKREFMDSILNDLQTKSSNTENSLTNALAALAASENTLVSTQDDLAATRANLANSQESASSAQDDLTVTQQNFVAVQGELAAARTALANSQNDLSATRSELAVKGLSEAALRQRIEKLAAGMSDEKKARLAEAVAAAALRARLKGAQDELTAMTLSLEKQRQAAEDTLTLLAAAELAERDALDVVQVGLTDRQKKAALLAIANSRLTEEKALSAEGRRKVTLLNQQTVELRKQLDSLQGLLDQSNSRDTASKVQIESLGSNLNAALAQVAAKQKRLAQEQKARADLEEKERIRLEAETIDLKKFRSEFFGRLREVLGSQDGIRIVGDRFIFSSEILFGTGSADLGDRGKAEIRKVANIILDVADQIPEGIDWVLRVDGHTDKTQVSGFGKYKDNWELSQGRALSVVKYLIEDLGIPANRLAANGFGEFQPIVDGDSPEALALNRRIELKFTEK